MMERNGPFIFGWELWSLRFARVKLQYFLDEKFHKCSKKIRRRIILRFNQSNSCKHAHRFKIVIRFKVFTLKHTCRLSKSKISCYLNKTLNNFFFLGWVKIFSRENYKDCADMQLWTFNKYFPGKIHNMR